MMDRKAFIAYILKWYRKVEPQNPTIKILEKRLGELTDKEITELRDKLEREECYLPFFRENYNKDPVDLDRWRQVSDELNAGVFERVWKEDPLTGDVVLSEHPYWIGLLPVRRMSQYLNSKISVSKDNNVRDAITGQVTGDSKSSALSNPQLNALLARGCIKTATEFVKLRSGDVEASRAYNRQLINEGQAYQEPILALDTEARVKTSFRSYLNTLHLSTTL